MTVWSPIGELWYRRLVANQCMMDAGSSTIELLSQAYRDATIGDLSETPNVNLCCRVLH
ncbi:hypothetical protein EV363DRAFT_1399218 [Boletus edulis]|uniref:Uncharacterized protein n=1 Tax=Boletus edulis BED1 TaxID=1328754 RepID=A0AAD4C999_BOLED|nr:hypothetical protein EV363DRAFT_1399218 [Boletus edulis]KAF8425397.1 hypothetical protein L210DRAFT_3566944 [Boletus edulis BED1]KAF8451979.1 hypothetical protein L210DRAFT_3515305 [Boletus edulis BED1]KAF8452047.1 hypothetical protein L210DRAFT_3516374 [Boletus edulis BED1]